MTNEEIEETYDSRYYDTEAMIIDNNNGNFSEDDADSYETSNIVMNSLINGQFNQAQDQCAEYGLCYDVMIERYNCWKNY